MSRTYTLTPAYGRDFKSAREAQENFLAGRGWILQPEGLYCSASELPAGALVQLRYCRNTRVTVTVVPDKN